MATYTSTIQLYGATDAEYELLRADLENQAKKRKQSFVTAPVANSEERSYLWEGNVTLQKVAETILYVAPKIGRKYSFSIMKNKQLAV